MMPRSYHLCTTILGFLGLFLLAACGSHTATFGDAGSDALPIIGGVDCTGDQTRCALDGGLEICVSGKFVPSKCPSGSVCADGECKSVICTPDETVCESTAAEKTCNKQGTGFLDPVACDNAQVCTTGKCAGGCVVDTLRCDGSQVLKCGNDGKEVLVTTCNDAEGEVCADGQCYSACDWASAKRSNIGCHYVAADLPNDVTADDNVFAFAFSNPSEDKSASVTISYPNGQTVIVGVPPKGLTTHKLPVPRTMMVRGTGLSLNGFVIDSSRPIVAFMFNPLEKYDTPGKSVATNDASLLLPIGVLGTSYLAVTWSDPAQYSEPPFVTVVGIHPGTTVTVTPSVTITLKIAPYLMEQGKPYAFTLGPKQVLNLESKGGDLTGTRVESTLPVAVFSGNACARVPNAGRFCDHIETQLPPLNTWGKTFWATKFTDRGGEADYYRVVAQEKDTTLTFDPPRANVPTLKAGGFYQFEDKGHFKLVADKPVILAQFMASMNMTDPLGPFGQDKGCSFPDAVGSCWGDPSMLLVSPQAQWRDEYIFLVPDTYKYDFINLALPTGVAPLLDDQSVDLSGAQSIGDGSVVALTLPIGAGYHRLAAAQPFALTIYGFDHNISYAYIGGLNLNILATPKP